MDVGSIIRRRRDELSLSQVRLAELAGVSQGYLSKLEKGLVHSPGIRSLFSLASALRIDPRRLLDTAKAAARPERNGRPRRGRAPATWTTWYTLPPCLSSRTGAPCPACRDWPIHYRAGALAALGFRRA